MTYSVGYIILAHNNLHRVAQVAEYITGFDCPAVIHIDAKASQDELQGLKLELIDNPLIHFVDQTRTEWGDMSLVTASLDCARAMLDKFPSVGHMMLCSGSCLPVRPISDLVEFLRVRQGTDFIESVSIDGDGWVQDGLGAERFKFYFPFSWKKQRWLFDAFTALQRRLGVNRKIPDNLSPHMGSQWWCLTKETLEKLINDPARTKYERYFSKTWIPDESYFQTLVRKHTDRLESRSLTWSKFDGDGKPFLMYDDHFDNIQRSGAFMVRKIWPKADALYQRFLSKDVTSVAVDDTQANNAFSFFDDVRNIRKPSFDGKLNPGRFPTGQHATMDKSVRKYTVLMGAKYLYPDMQDWLSKIPNLMCHGNLFDPDGVQFADGVDTFQGNVSANRLIRNYRAPAFLTNVLWNRRDVPHVFFYDLGDNQKAHNPIFKDPNAQVILIKDAWVLQYLALKKIGADTRSKAKVLHASEQRLKQVIARMSTQAEVMEFGINDIVQDPSEYLRVIQKTVAQASPTLVSAPIQGINVEELNETIRKLSNDGFKLETTLILQDQKPVKIAGKRPRLVER